MLEENKPIKFRIQRIFTEQFAVFESVKTLNEDDLLFTLKLNFLYASHFTITTIVRAEFENKVDKTPLLIAQVHCDYDIFPEDWEKHKKDGTIILPKNFAISLLAIALGVVRGVIHAKTSEIGINNLIIPPINISEQVNEDVSIDLTSADHRNLQSSEK